jgi:hypothetical protein
MGKKYPVVILEHEHGKTVYCWGQQHGIEAVEACLKTHPEEAVTVRQIKMTEKQYDALPDYDGDC